MQEVNNNMIYNATKWSSFVNIVRKLVTPITNMILARILSPEAFGIVATITIVISFAEIFTDAGFQKYIVQHNFKDEMELKNSANVAFWTNFILAIIIWGIIFIFREALASVVGSKGYGKQLTVAGISIPLIALSSIQQAILRRKFDFRSMFIPSLVSSIVPLFITVPVAVVFRNSWALIIGTLAGHFSNSAIYYFISKWKPSFYYDWSLLKDMLSFSVWTMLESIIIWLTVNIDIFILSRIFSEYYMGLYKAGLTTISGITSIITASLIPVLFSTLSRYQNNEEKFNNIFFTFQKNASLLMMPMSIGIFIYRDVITYILLGEQWEEITGYIGVLGFVQAGNILISCFASEVYRAKGEPMISVFVQVVFVFFLGGVLVFTATHSSFENVCFVRAISLLIFMIMHTIILRIRYKISIKRLYSSSLYALIPSVIMSVVGWELCIKIESMFFKTISIFICILVYVCSCMCIPNIRKSIISIFKQ